jgi:hypothetical protein
VRFTTAAVAAGLWGEGQGVVSLGVVTAVLVNRERRPRVKRRLIPLHGFPGIRGEASHAMPWIARLVSVHNQVRVNPPAMNARMASHTPQSSDDSSQSMILGGRPSSQKSMYRSSNDNLARMANAQMNKHQRASQRAFVRWAKYRMRKQRAITQAIQINTRSVYPRCVLRVRAGPMGSRIIILKIVPMGWRAARRISHILVLVAGPVV